MIVISVVVFMLYVIVISVVVFILRIRPASVGPDPDPDPYYFFNVPMLLTLHLGKNVSAHLLRMRV